MIKNILLIDDSEADNFLHEYLLKKSGLVENVYTALNVEKAIAFLEDYNKENKQLPEVILLDINMPRLNGWEFLDMMNSKPHMDLSKSAIYMLTTSLNPDDKDKAMIKYKLKNFFNKPLNIDHINEIIAENNV